MEIIEWNLGKRYETYIQFIHGRPQKSLRIFLKQIGAKEVPGTDGMLWKLPDLTEETIRRYFEYLTGMKAEGTNASAEWMNNVVEGIDRSKLTFWMGDCMRYLRKWIQLYMGKVPSD